jgi:bifunctional ADP-heptose synthase (sugar kinase/adenylyltransferase)
VKAFVEAFKGANVMVVGDQIDDIYFHGHADRLSPEAPVPVFIEDRTECRAGGAANVAANLRALGCGVMSIYGNDISTKRRFMIGNHCLLRVDHDATVTGISEFDRNHIHDMMHDMDAVVLSDYAKGVLEPEVCRFVMHVAEGYGLEKVRWRCAYMPKPPRARGRG